VRNRFLKKAANSLDGLGEMVQELLLLSQLETGVLRMKTEIFELGRLAQEVAEQLEEKAIDRSQTLTLDRPPRPLWVEADRSRIRQVLVNLTENAIKYGKEGGIVRLYLYVERDQISVRVQDDGPGIPSEHLARIFERFYRVEKSRSKDMGGIGLGLAIVKQILEAHDVRIDVQSEVGIGTEFQFQFKRQKPSTAKKNLQDDSPVAVKTTKGSAIS
jgi:two-component system phosphate regulon sensor histidine kinase PhoR